MSPTSWKDPDTGIIHAIEREEGKEHKPGLYESADLHALSTSSLLRSFFRQVTMACGMRVLLEGDEFIALHGEAVLRPWITGREAPTCVLCAVATPKTPMRNDWGSNIRGL